MSLIGRAMRRYFPLPEVLEPPKPVPASEAQQAAPKPEWERIAEEIIDARAQDPVPGMWGPGNWPGPYGPDPVVFGSVPRVGKGDRW